MLDLLPAAAARAAHLSPGPAVAMGAVEPLGTSPGAQAVQTALSKLSAEGGCALLATLHRLDDRGGLTDAAVFSAVAQAEGGPS
jgi:hypothetical protein